MSSFNFRMGGCAWCHPGGGPMEYDRAGYRYDGGFSGYLSEIGEAPSQMNPDAATTYGDYFVFDPTNAAANAFGLVSKVGAAGKGVAEVDCLMCHLDAPYNNEARDYCMTKPGAGPTGMAPKLGPTMGLTLSGEVTTVEPGSLAGGNPSCDFTYTDGVIDAALIAPTPKKENCALCHFADVSMPKGKGPAAAPLDWTTFQKKITAGTVTDSDTGEANAADWLLTKGRAEFGKRGESINNPNDHDVHMDGALGCIDCHYNLDGNFDPLLNSNGEVIQPALTGVQKIDHQFAKGNNRPDGKNMDQFDNTVTCEGCHWEMTHPGVSDNGDGTFSFETVAGAVLPLPVPTHPAFPALHFGKIDCRTCHIPELNFVKKQLLADYSTSPFPDVGIGRGQFIIKKIDHDSNPATPPKPQPIGYKPLYAWVDRGHAGEEPMLSPVVLGSAAVWKDLANGLPYSKRFAVGAAKVFRDTQGGDGTLGNPYAWTLNAKQNGDAALIANTAAEVSGMVDVLKGITAGPKLPALGPAAQLSEPALNIFINTFTVSHMVKRDEALGSQASGGCAACHSQESLFFNSAPQETDATKPCFGQPEGCKGLVFMQPADGGIGLEMTCDGGDCTSGTGRVTGGVSFACPDGSKIQVDLTEGLAHGQAVTNVIDQAQILCYNNTMMEILRQPQFSPYLDNLDAKFSGSQDPAISLQVNLDATPSECPSTCDYEWDFGDGATGAGELAAHVYGTAGDYVVTLKVTDQPTGYYDTNTLTVRAVEYAPPLETTVTPTQTDNLLSLGIVAGMDTTIAGLYVYWGDGTRHIFTDPAAIPATVDHTYTRNGTFYCKVYVFDSYGQRTNFVFTVPVTNL